MITNKFLFLFGFLFLIFLASCKHDSIPPEESSGVSFSKDIQPILNYNCNYSGCHNSKNLTNFPLETYSDVLNYGDVVPFNPIGSNFYDVIDRGYMPRSDSLSNLDKHLIYDWISKGALNN